MLTYKRDLVSTALPDSPDNFRNKLVNVNSCEEEKFLRITYMPVNIYKKQLYLLKIILYYASKIPHSHIFYSEY